MEQPGYRGVERGFKLSAEARQALENHSFPGNVRELRNLLERISVLAPASTIQPWDLPIEIRGATAVNTDATETEENLAAAVANAEKRCILQALKKTADNKTEAAAILGISRKNLWEKMKSYGL